MSELLDAARKAYNDEDASIYAKVAKEPKKNADKRHFLTKEEKKAITAKRKNDMSVKDIANDMNLPYESVRRYIKKSFAKPSEPDPEPEHKDKTANVPDKNVGKTAEVRPAPAISGIAMLGRLDCMIQETYGTEAAITSVSGTAEWCELTFTFGGDEYNFGFSRKSCE